MQKEYHITGKKKDVYPSKKVINLYYKEDKTTRPSTIALYVLFIAVVMLALAKVGIYDKMEELSAAKAEYTKQQQHLEEQMAYLEKYNEVSSQYSRYSYSYLNEDEKVTDRMDILAILEETVYRDANVLSTIITGNVISIQYKDLTLEETAWLVQRLDNYAEVEKVEVNTATMSTSNKEKNELSTTMVITLVDKEAKGGDE